MKWLSKFYLILWPVLAVTLVAIGCGEDDAEQTAEDPFRGLEIEIALPAGFELKQAWQPILDEWSAQTGASCTIREYDSIDVAASGPDNAAWSLLLDRDGKPIPSAKPGLIVFPTTRITLLNELNLLAPIPEQVQGEANLQWLDLFSGLRQSVAMTQNEPNFKKKQPVAHPISNPTLVCYYRKDLLQAAGLQPPQTWHDYESLIDGLPDWANGLAAVEPWDESYRATMFVARAVSSAKHSANYSLFFDIQTGEPLINLPSFVRALEQAERAVQKMPAETLHYKPVDCRREIFAGRAALAIAFETGPRNPSLPFGPDAGSQPTAVSTQGADPNTDSTRAEDIEIGVCRLPGARQVYNCSTDEWSKPSLGDFSRTTLCGFGGLCVGVAALANDVEAQAAWNLLATIAVENTNAAFPEATKSMCRQSQRDVAVMWLGDELTNDERQQYLDVVTESLNDRNLVAELPILKRDQFQLTLTHGISDVLASKKSPQESLDNVASKWREIVGSNDDADQVLNSYRHSLGLPPRISLSDGP